MFLTAGRDDNRVRGFRISPELEQSCGQDPRRLEELETAREELRIALPGIMFVGGDCGMSGLNFTMAPGVIRECPKIDHQAGRLHSSCRLTGARPPGPEQDKSLIARFLKRSFT